jgi:hypothetical protein
MITTGAEHGIGRMFDQNEGDIACNAEPSSPA